MSGWCQTLLLDSQKSLLFLCKREVLSRRECFRTLIYLEMTQLFSTRSSLSLAQDRNSGNQNTWRNDCMFSSVHWSVVSDSLGPRGLQDAGLPCPSPTPGACSNSRSEERRVGKECRSRWSPYH